MILRNAALCISESIHTATGFEVQLQPTNMGLAKGCTDKLPYERRFSLERLSLFLPE